MMLALMFSLLVPAPSSPAASVVRSDDPPIRVWLNQDNYFERGDRARVHVKMAEDGYLVVLRADADGRVRVLFPLDPGDDAFVRGGKTVEVRGRGDREAFYVDEREGTGAVLAARSVAPFRFDEFLRGDHWDYRVLDARQVGGNGSDKETALLDLVQRMVPDGHFDYDVVTYAVASRTAYYSSPCFGCGSPYYGWHLSLGFGYPYSRYGFASYGSACFDPFFYDPFFCGPAFYDPFFYDPFFYGPFFFRPFVHRPFIFVSRPFIVSRPIIFVGGLGIIRGSNLLANRVRPGFRGPLVFKGPAAATVMGVGPRLRVPQGTLLSRATPVSVRAATPVRVRDLVSAPSRASVRAREPMSDRASAPVRIREPAPAREPMPVREPSLPVRDGRSAPSERWVPEVRMPERREGGRDWGRRAPEGRRDPGFSGGGRMPAGRDRGYSPRGFSGSGRAATPSNRGGGRRRS